MSYYDYSTLSSLMKDKGKTFNKNIKNKDNEEPKYKIKLGQEKEKIPLDNGEKMSKGIKNNINGKKENGIGYIDTPNPNRENNKSKPDIDDDILNQVLSQKETKLLTDSQYVSFDNFIGDNSCYTNVIMHFLYLFPCVNDFLIKKYQEQLKRIEEEKQNQKEKEKEKESPKETQKESQKETQKESQKETQKEVEKEQQEEESELQPKKKTSNPIIK